FAFVFNLIPASPRHLSQNLSSEIFHALGFLPRREAPEMLDLKYSKYSPRQTKRDAMRYLGLSDLVFMQLDPGVSRCPPL
ncbi:hypothetical protein pdam_00003673, partial [Pocillopora damicornis]